MNNNYIILSDEQMNKELEYRTDYILNNKLQEYMANNVYLSGKQKRALKRKIRRNLNKRNI